MKYLCCKIIKKEGHPGGSKMTKSEVNVQICSPKTHAGNIIQVQELIEKHSYLPKEKEKFVGLTIP